MYEVIYVEPFCCLQKISYLQVLETWWPKMYPFRKTSNIIVNLTFLIADFILNRTWCNNSELIFLSYSGLDNWKSDIPYVLHRYMNNTSRTSNNLWRYLIRGDIVRVCLPVGYYIAPTVRWPLFWVKIRLSYYVETDLWSTRRTFQIKISASIRRKEQSTRFHSTLCILVDIQIEILLHIGRL